MTNEAKLLIAFMAMLIFLSLGTGDLSAQYAFAPDAPTWRLVSSLQTSAWSYGMNGGSSETQSQNYYTGSSSTLPDSTVDLSWSHVSNIPTVSIYQYYYTDLPDYYEHLTILSYRPHPSGSGYRRLERFDYEHRPLLSVKYRGNEPGGVEMEKDEYSYNDAGYLAQKIEYRTKSQTYGPKNVIRYSYRPDAKILTQHIYTVINGDLENLELNYNDQRFYDSSGLQIALVSRSSATSFHKNLYDYNLDGQESKARFYNSNDSLNWVLSDSRETIYDLSFGESQPFRKDYYWYSSSDSSSVRDSSYQLFSYLDFNRDIYQLTYYGDGTFSNSVHFVYNEDMKLLLQHSYRDDGDNDGEHRHAEYVWEIVVANEDLVQQVPGLSLRVYPNPFRATSKICYSLKDSGTMKLELYNLRGQKVKTLISEGKKAGEHELDMDLTDLNLASGVYILRASSNGSMAGRKLMLLK
jgi:hypothetical protein